MSALFDFTGKKAIVTGGIQGLGRGIADGFAAEGMQVAILDVNPNTAQLAAEAGFIGVQADLSNAEQREAAFQEAVAKLGGTLDVIVNCAGIQRRYKSEEFPLSDFNKVIDINLTSVFAMCQLAGRVMLQQGHGKIINIASMLSFFGGYTVPAYAASKGGVAQITKAMANEWAGRGINVNALAPGYMDTEMNVALINDPGRNTEILARIPAGRWGTPQDMAGAALFLASAASDYLNGAVIPVDGGYLSR